MPPERNDRAAVNPYRIEEERIAVEIAQSMSNPRTAAAHSSSFRSAHHASPPPGYHAWDRSAEYDEEDQAMGQQVGDEEGDEGEDDDEEDEEEDYAASETSSAMYDPDADPEGFARRQDELAGILEIGEEETRALKWGPPLRRLQDGE
jgi:hypothetical protein